ncbi:MAG: hypothetical protein FWF84_04290 [Kiritimatiellaeota bacterium]|nr:hypothetical protein [Kiritimatiellota bacterium]
MNHNRVNAMLKRLILAIAVVAFSACVGCESQRDPGGENTPWTATQPWELTPTLPGGMGR